MDPYRRRIRAAVPGTGSHTIPQVRASLARSDRDHPYVTCQTCKITYAEPTVPDDQAPQYVFRTTDSDLLAALLRAEVDLNALARAEMANRGLDRDGKWIGHQAAAALWRKGVPAG